MENVTISYEFQLNDTKLRTRGNKNADERKRKGVTAAGRCDSEFEVVWSDKTRTAVEPFLVLGI
jgi:hypothetical protein